MTVVYLVLMLGFAAMVIIGLRDLGRYLWFRAEEAVYDQDISNAYRSGNKQLAIVRTEDRRLWLKHHPCPRMTWLGMPMVIIVMIMATIALIMFATAMYLWDRFFDQKSAATVGPYRQVR